MDYKATYTTGFVIDGWDDCYDGCFAIECNNANSGDENYTFGDFWADVIGDVPTGAIYHDGFLIVHNTGDGLALMRTLHDDYVEACNNLEASMASWTYHDLGWA